MENGSTKASPRLKSVAGVFKHGRHINAWQGGSIKDLLALVWQGAVCMSQPPHSQYPTLRSSPRARTWRQRYLKARQVVSAMWEVQAHIGGQVQLTDICAEGSEDARWEER